MVNFRRINAQLGWCNPVPFSFHGGSVLSGERQNGLTHSELYWARPKFFPPFLKLAPTNNNKTGPLFFLSIHQKLHGSEESKYTKEDLEKTSPEIQIPDHNPINQTKK